MTTANALYDVSGPAAVREFLHTGKLIASNLDYDLPFIPVGTEAVDVVPAEPGTLLPRVQ